MRIKKLWAVNFRGLKDIKLENTQDVNVIVGPNAVGKSTLLEAVRLPKAILAPRLNIEGHQALINIGGISPHHQAMGASGVDIGGLANDQNNPINIGFTAEVDDTELAALNSIIGPMSIQLLQAELATPGTDGNLVLAQYLSRTEGQKRLKDLSEQITERLSSLSAGSPLNIELIMDGKQGTVRGSDSLSQIFIGGLDRRLPINKTMFSLFPADRVLPQGEQPIQLGSADTQQQLLSHIALPAIKYSRVKQVIIQNILLGGHEIGLVKKEIDLIFSHLLPGKNLEAVQMNPMGSLKVLVKDQVTGKIFDIDYMSSGEKGLLMTFLFIRLSMQPGGVVLLDEPELHLNAAVQERILQFVIDYCVKELSIQVFLCTHSPEIVKDAFIQPSCGLFHLRSGMDLTPVLKHDHKEVFEICGRLGNSTADTLFTKGNICL